MLLMSSRLILLVQSLLAVLTVIAGASDLSDLMPAAAARWLVLGTAALSAGVGMYNARVGTMPRDFRYPASDAEARMSPRV